MPALAVEATVGGAGAAPGRRIGSTALRTTPAAMCTSGSSATTGMNGAQAEALRVPYADGTLFPLPVGEDDALMPSLLTLSDVIGTGHPSLSAWAWSSNRDGDKHRPVGRAGAAGRVGVPQEEVIPASEAAFFGT